MMREVNCPCFLCGSRQSHILFETTYPYFNYPGTFRMNRCDTCGLLFNSPQLSDDEINRLYEKQYYFFRRREAEEFRRVADIYLRTVAMMPEGTGRNSAIEIGSAKGYFLALLKHLGWDVLGIEISPEAVRYSASRFGIPTFQGSIEDYVATVSRKSFSAVFTIDVIEHIPHPIIFLQSIDKIIADGGLLFIDTPNGNAQNIVARGHQWQGFNPFHIFLFTENNLISMLARFGYSLERAFSYGNESRHQQQGDRTRMQNVARSLGKAIFKKAGLLNPAQDIYDGLANALRRKQTDPGALLEKAVRYIDDHHSYLTSEDAGHELAAGNRGDNLMMIFRKRAG